MESETLFNMFEKKLVLNKNHFDYFGLLQVKPEQINRFSSKTQKDLQTIITNTEKRVFLRGQTYYSSTSIDNIFKLDTQLSQLYDQINHENEDGLTTLKLLFSIVEHKINFGIKIYFSLFKNTIFDTNLQEELDILKNKIQEDYNLLISIMHGSFLPNSSNSFKKILNTHNIESRNIEMDHKYILFSRMRDLWIQPDSIKNVVSPMSGGIHIPFILKATFNYLNTISDNKIEIPHIHHIMHGCYDNKEYGDIIRSNKLNPEEKLEQVMPKRTIEHFLNMKSVLVIDDNTGTGGIIRDFSGFFPRFFDEIEFGFIELNWKHIDDVNTGKRDSTYFDINQIKYPTFRNYRHHNILDSLTDFIKQGDGTNYFLSLKKLGMQNGYVPDTECMFNQGYNYAKKIRSNFKTKRQFK